MDRAVIIRVLTLFPSLFDTFLHHSIVGVAVRTGAVRVHLTDIRDFAFNRHRQVDDYPYGGGAGMIFKPEPLAEAIRWSLHGRANVPVVYLTPQGRLLRQPMVRQMAEWDEVVLVCGHYKEIDQRIRERYITHEVSIGDYVLSGGETAAMVLIDSLARLQDDVLSDPESAGTDSHEHGILGAPHYTRPVDFEGMVVPQVLRSGDHARIEAWRQQQALELTRKIRPDLINDEGS